MSPTNVTFVVPAVSCMHCVKAVKTALGKLNGVSQVEVDLGAKRVAVTYEAGTVAVDDLKRTLAAAGYPVAG